MNSKDIIDWLSRGQRVSYYYNNTNDKEVFKIKGFTLNYENTRKLNSRSMEKVIDGIQSAIALQYDQVNPDTLTKDLVMRKCVQNFPNGLSTSEFKIILLNLL